MNGAGRDHAAERRALPRRSFLAATLGAAGMAATGCLASPAADRGTLRVARSESFDGWVPDKAATYATYQTLTAVLEPLLRVSPDGTGVVPGIAESWHYDSGSWTFRLRGGVRFSDGSPVTAADVAFSAEMWKDGPNFGPNYAFERVRTRGPSTVVFDMQYPDATFPSRMASQPSAVVPKNFGDRPRHDYFADPVGAGAFTVDDWSPSGAITLNRNPRYYRSSGSGVDRLRLQVADANSAAAQFLSGQVHICEFVGAQAAPQYADGLVESPPSQINHLSLNTTRAPLNDQALRTAIAYAVDYEGIAKGAFLGYASPLRGILPPNVANYAEPSVSPYSRDVRRAERALAETAAAPGRLEVIYDAGVAADDLIAQIVASNLAEIGIGVDLTAMETGAFLDRAYALDADMMIWSYGAITPDMSDPLGWILGTSWLFTGTDTGSLQRRYNAYLAATSAPKRREIVTEVQDDALRHAAALPLSETPVLTGVSERLSGYTAAPWGLYYWDPIKMAG